MNTITAIILAVILVTPFLIGLSLILLKKRSLKKDYSHKGDWSETNPVWKRKIVLFFSPFLLAYGLFFLQLIAFQMWGFKLPFEVALLTAVLVIITPPLCLLPGLIYLVFYFREKYGYSKKFNLPQYMSSLGSYWNNIPKLDQLIKDTFNVYKERNIKGKIDRRTTIIQFPEYTHDLRIEKLPLHYNQEFRFVLIPKSDKTESFPGKLAMVIDERFG